jgi:hypothetical protein
MAETKTYRLERLADLLSVPSDRREQCVRELLLALELAEFADAKLTGPMTWTDDGDMSCSLDDKDGNELLSLEVTHG